MPGKEDAWAFVWKALRLLRPDGLAALLLPAMGFLHNHAKSSLAARKRLIRVEPVSQGLVDTLLVHPREVFKSAIAANASFVVLTHNHPSGDPSPSEQDVKVTRDLVRAGHLLQIEVLDHIIMGKKTREGGRDYTSLRELGFIYT